MTPRLAGMPVLATAVLAVVAVAMPFIFAILRASETGGQDLRYLWVALAASCGATAGWAASRDSGTRVSGVLAVFTGAALCGAIAASLLGVSVGPGMFVVVGSFALCFGAGALLYRGHSRR